MMSWRSGKISFDRIFDISLVWLRKISSCCVWNVGTKMSRIRMPQQRSSKRQISTYNLPWRNRRGVQVQLYSFFDLGVRWEWEVKTTPRPLYPRERDQLPIVQEASWTNRADLDGYGIFPDYRVSIPGTVQPVASRYTDYAIPADERWSTLTKIYTFINRSQRDPATTRGLLDRHHTTYVEHQSPLKLTSLGYHSADRWLRF